MKQGSRVVAAMVILLMMFFSVSVSAQSNVDLLSEKATDELEKADFQLGHIPDFLTEKQVKENDHIKRLYDRENALNTVVFQNRDGGTTTYLFAKPVKYIDDTGKVNDKSTLLTVVEKSDRYVYASLDNDIKVYYPGNVNDGVKIALSEYEIVFYPIDCSAETVAEYNVTGSLSDNKTINRIKYSDVYGEQTALQYTPCISGVKEDIILNKYNGINNFSFRYITNGLSVKEVNGTYCLIDASDIIVGTLGEILCLDSGENKEQKISIGKLEVEEIKPGNEYRITVVVDKNFLEDEGTQYPVYIDPSFNFGESVIIDKGIYRPSSAGSSLSVNQLAIGTPVDGSTVRMLYGLTDSSFLSSINESTLESVALNVFTWVGEYPPGIYICPYLEVWNDGGIEYCSSEASFDNYGSSEPDPFYQEAFAQEYCAYGIDNILSYWLDIESTGYGFIIISDGEGDCDCYGSYGLALASVENVSYLTSISINEYANVALTDFSISGSTTMSPNATQMCGIVPTPSNATSVNNVNFTWSSSNSSVVSVSSSGLLSSGANAGTCIITAQHIPTGISRNITVTVANDYSGTYFVQNKQTRRYMSVENSSNNEGADIEQWDFSNDNKNKWVISRKADGSYTIKSVLSNKYVGVENNSTNNNAAIKQYTNDNGVGTRWIISVTEQGDYVFVSKTMPILNKALSIPEGTTLNGTNLIQYTYTNNSDYCDEWKLFNVGSYLGSLSYWNSDSDCIGYWNNSPSMYQSKVCTSNSFYFSTGCVTALSQWENALSIDISTINESDADIKCFGITAEDYYAMTQETWCENNVGLSEWAYYNMGIKNYGNEMKYIKRMVSCTIYILSYGATENSTQNTVTHELGHALGYFGHSPSDYDVMNAGVKDDYALKPAEINHLDQLY